MAIGPRKPSNSSATRRRTRPPTDLYAHIRSRVESIGAGSGSVPFVAMMPPADFGPRHDTTGADRLDGARLRRILAEREVRSRALVIRHVRSKQPSEMPLVEHDHMVQTLAADGPNDAF